MFNIVLVEPEIPHNTGAIGRLVLSIGGTLHLVEPLGFSLEEKAVRRAGLDYWKDVELKMWKDWGAFAASVADWKRVCMMSTKVTRPHWEFEFERGDYLIFGSETRGLAAPIHATYPGCFFTLPMVGEKSRSLNLATAVAATAYEGVRQVSISS